MLKIDELLNYESNAIKPKHFDELYDNEIKSATYSEVTINHLYDISNISCNELIFKADDGALIYSKYVYDTTKKIKNVVLVFHGYHVNSGDFANLFMYTALGCAVIAMDVRGQSGKSMDIVKSSGTNLKGLIIRGFEDGFKNLGYLETYKDVVRLSKVVNELYADVNIITIGESQGGALALVCSALCDNVILSAVSYPYLSDFIKAYELGHGYSGVEAYFRYDDVLLENYDYFFEQLSYLDIQFLMERIKGDVHLFCGLKDDVSPPICQFASFNKIKSNKKYYLFNEYGHEPLPKINDIIVKLISKI